jgi:hypothetical protein
MRRSAWLLSMLALAACSSSDHGSKLTLRNTQWDHVNVQVVITRSSDCDAKGGPDFVGAQDFVLHRDQTKTIAAPDETTVCWRHDRYPTNPHPGEWSGWSKAILFPGNDTTTDL